MTARLANVLVLGLIVGLLGACSPNDATPDPPHIVFILADDLGYGDLGAYNSESRIPTPHLDELATESMLFTDAHAPGAVCVPSRYGLLTGRHPHRIHSPNWRERPLIDPGQTTLARALQERGYTTYMVGKWHLGFESGTDYECSESLRGGPVDRGFDHYFGIPASLDQPPYFYIRDDRCVEAPTDTTEGNQTDSDVWTDIQGAFWRSGNKAPNFRHDDVLPRFTDETISYLNAYQKRDAQAPLFLYVALAAPHTPWLPADSLEGTSNAGSYGDFVSNVDGSIGRILSALNRLGMNDNTLVVFASDNGSIWYDKDEDRFGHRSTHQYRGMKADAWEGGHRVPFLARWPDHIPQGATSDQLLTFTDIVPTLADIGGTALSDDSTDGVNIGPVLTAKSDSVERDGAVFQSTYYLAVREGPWKLIPGLGSGGFISTPNTREPESGEPEGQLYHLGDDPSEQNNLYDEYPQVVDRLTDRLHQYRKQRPEASRK